MRRILAIVGAVVVVAVAAILIYTATKPDSFRVQRSVTIGMTIGPDGAVSAARVARNTTSDDSLGTCLQNEVRQWRLSPPPGGESVMMNLPFSR